jgi:hypothetical protein
MAGSQVEFRLDRQFRVRSSPPGTAVERPERSQRRGAGQVVSTQEYLGESIMGQLRVLMAALVLSVCGSAAAQEWNTYTSMEDGFRVHAPCEFGIEDTMWDSEYGAVMPARIYSCDAGPQHYQVTVVDYTDAQAIHAARENRTEADYIDLYWEIDVRASPTYAASKIRARPGEVTFDAYHYIDRVEGEQIQMTNPDQTRLYAAIYLHDSKLYIFEANVPPRTPPPGMFQQSLEFVDADGNRIRYRNFSDAPKVHNAPDRSRRERARQLRQEQNQQQ